MFQVKQSIADCFCGALLLCADDVIQCYKPWNEIEEVRVCDGCSYELTITYVDVGKKKMHGGVGGGTVDKIIMDFHFLYQK